MGWETNTTPSMGAHPQEIINKQLLEDADILIGVFWTRLGTSTTNYRSGTVEEIEKHINAGKLAKLYFSTAPVRLDSVDGDQYEALKKFKAECQDKGLLETYSDISDFQTKFSRQLQIELNQEVYRKTIGVQLLSVAPVGFTLTSNAEELLLAAASDKHGHIMHMSYIGGEGIHTGGRNFIEDRSPRTAALWKQCLQELEDNSLIEDMNHKGQIYSVTNKGYELAERINQQSPKAYV